MEKYHVKYSVLCLSQTTKYWTMFFLRCVISHFISLWYFLLISTEPKCVIVELFQWLITRSFNVAIWYCLKDYTFFVIRTPPCIKKLWLGLKWYSCCLSSAESNSRSNSNAEVKAGDIVLWNRLQPWWRMAFNRACCSF